MGVAASDENLVLARRVYEGFERAFELHRAGRLDEWEAMPEWDELYDPEVVLEEVQEIPDSDAYRGVDGIKRWFRAGAETFEEVRWQPRDFSPRGPHVLVEVRGTFRGKSSGAETVLDVTHVFTMRDGRIVRMRAFLDQDAARAAVEAEEPGSGVA